MYSEQAEAGRYWLDRETGTQFVVIEVSRGTVLLFSADKRETCSIEPENFASRFAPLLPPKPWQQTTPNEGIAK